MTAGPTPGARTVVEAFVADDGTADLGVVYDVAVALGMGEQPVRLAIRRMVAAGEAEQHGRGRRATLRLTPGHDLRERHDAEFLALAAEQDAGRLPWDGTWHLLAFTIPEDRRAVRDALRSTLVRLGGAPLAAGLYVSPHDWDAVVDAETATLDVADALTRADTRALRTGGESDPRRIAARLWPLADIAAAYAPLDAVLDEVAHHPPSPADDLAGSLALALRLATAADAALRDDPLLPPELLPDDWPPRRSRARFAAAWAELTRDGQAAALYPRYR